MHPSVCLAIAGLLLAAQPGWAFSSLSWGEALQNVAMPGRARDPRHDHGHRHREITALALAPLGFTPEAVRLVGWQNFLTDWEQYAHTLAHPPTERYRPGDHFDRNEGETSQWAFERGLKGLATQRQLAVGALRQGRVEDGLAALGRGLHAVQDGCAHSNLIDLPAGERQLVLALLLGEPASPAALLSKLRLTGTSRKVMADLEPAADREPGFGHQTHAKDDAGYNAEARARAAGGRTKYELAFETAVTASRAFALRVRDEAGPEAWARALRYPAP